MPKITTNDVIMYTNFAQISAYMTYYRQELS